MAKQKGHILMPSLNEKIRSRREELKLSQEQLASMAGITRRSVVSYETTDKRPYPSTLRKLATALGVTVYYLENDDVEDPSARLEEEPYIQAARDAFGKKGAEEMAAVLAQNESLFAGATLTEEQKDIFYQAVSQAYFRNKERAREKFGKKTQKY